MSMIGKSLAHYEVSAQIGRGGMGEVYQTSDKKRGGNSPRWSPDGQELFYLVGETETEVVMVVPVETEPAFKPGTPRILFRGRYVGAFPTNGIPWDIHPDRKRFLMMKTPGTSEATEEEQTDYTRPRRITIVLNWDQELKKRVPVD